LEHFSPEPLLREEWSRTVFLAVTTSQTKSGYDVLEWYGGHDPDKGDVLVGRYKSYGFHDIYDETVDADGRVWTEDYSLSRESGLEKLTEQCE
jgi:hypothetical protein